jgi:hypothetical protein
VLIALLNNANRLDDKMARESRVGTGCCEAREAVRLLMLDKAVGSGLANITDRCAARSCGPVLAGNQTESAVLSCVLKPA